jgi:hypothetical protein
VEFGPPAPRAIVHVGMVQEGVVDGGDRGGVTEQHAPVRHEAVGGLDVDDEDVVYRTAGKREAGGWSFRAR